MKRMALIAVLLLILTLLPAALASAPEGGAERRPPCGPRPAACRGWGEAGRSPDGRDARRSGRKSADAARRAAGLRPGSLRPAGAQKAPGGAGGRGIIRRPRR